MKKNEIERNNLEDGKLNESEEKLDNLTNQKPSEELTEEAKKTEPEDDSSTESNNKSHPINSENIENPGDSNSEDSSESTSAPDHTINQVDRDEKNLDEDSTPVDTDNNPEKREDNAEQTIVENKNIDLAEEMEIEDKSTEIVQSEEEVKEEIPALETENIKPDETDEEPKEEVASVESKDDKSGETGIEENEKVKEAEEVASEDEHVEEAQLDYSNYNKKQMVQVLESLLKEDDFSQVGRILKEIKKPYDILSNSERKIAYEKYIEDGGEKDGFEYRPDELDQRFNLAFNKLRERKNQYYNSLEKQKEQNLNVKLEILEKIRELVDSEETGASIKVLKDLQVQWKEVGVIPSSQVKSLWANYNALLDRFYDQRSIYFELKELDRKKNHDLKIELCEKAEQLTAQENVREAIKQLNEFHEEFKHIGPVPKDDQEPIWGRFKAASDEVYSRRKDYYEKLKDELKINEVAKEALAEKVIPFAEFQSDRISDWNSKTKEIIAIQKEWEAIGSLPKEKAKNINKLFWSSFKSFFNKKGQFFKKIEEERRSNLKLKQELVEKAEGLKDSDDFRKTSDELKSLQKQWKEIGPVPEKFRNEVFIQFKKSCDHFFDRRRANSGKIEIEYDGNLAKKQKICDELEKMIKEEKFVIDRVKSIEKEWSEIGFVPKSNIKSIQKRYADIIGKISDKIDLPESEKHKLRFSAQFSNINYGPGAEKFIHKKEGVLRRQISTLESDINVWKNNLDFFASSKNADKLKEEFQVKIDKASAQLISLKEQLKVISNI